MNRKDARSLGRWCEKHQMKHRRVPICEPGGWATGCPECLAEPETAEALNALVEGAFRFYAETIKPGLVSDAETA